MLYLFIFVVTILVACVWSARDNRRSAQVTQDILAKSRQGVQLSVWMVHTPDKGSYPKCVPFHGDDGSVNVDAMVNAVLALCKGVFVTLTTVVGVAMVYMATRSLTTPSHLLWDRVYNILFYGTLAAVCLLPLGIAVYDALRKGVEEDS